MASLVVEIAVEMGVADMEVVVVAVDLFLSNNAPQHPNSSVALFLDNSVDPFQDK